MSIKLVIQSNHLTLCRPLLLLPSVFSSIRVFSSESALRIRWPEYCSFSFNISPSNEYSGLSSFRNWLVWFPCSPRDSQKSSLVPQLESINSSVLSLLYGPILPSVYDYWTVPQKIQQYSSWQSGAGRHVHILESLQLEVICREPSISIKSQLMKHMWLLW